MQTLLDHTETLTPGDRRRIRTLCFEVPEGVEALSLTFDYRPRRSVDTVRNEHLVDAAASRQLEEAAVAGILTSESDRAAAHARVELATLRRSLRNLLNLTVIDANGNDRGRWDRNLASEVEPDLIACEAASAGFVPGPLPAGRWTIAIEVHEIVTASCVATLDVSVARDPVVRPVAPARREIPAAEPEYVDELPAGWTRGELHCHTRCSDGVYEPLELLERAARLGLRFVAITDHNSVAAFSPLGGALPVMLLHGCEITTFRGHFPVLAEQLDTAPPWYRGERLLAPEELCRWVHAKPHGLFGIAHPFMLGNPICCGCRLEVPQAAQFADLLEVWSRGRVQPVADRHALALFDRLRREGRPVVATAGRDWHRPDQERVGCGRRFPATVVHTDAAVPGVPQLLEALRRGAAYLSVGPHVDFSLGCGGRSASLGESLQRPSDADAYSCEVELSALREPALLRLWESGAVVVERRVVPGADRVAALAFDRPLPSERVDVRLELWAEDGEPLLLSNPVTIEGEQGQGLDGQGLKG